MTSRRVVPYTVLAVGLTVALLTAPAWADGGGSSGALHLFDATDSHGIRVSQYELSTGGGGVFDFDPVRTGLNWILGLIWDLYRWWIALLAYLLDWTLNMSWVTWITGPLNEAATHLRSAVLEPLGGTRFGQQGVIALFCMVAGVIGGLAVLRGRAGGWATMLISAVASAVAVGVLATPVLTFAGDGTKAAEPLRYAARAGVELGNAATSGKIVGAPLDGDSPRAESGKILIDTFIRPVHQALNYGASIDIDDKACVGAYDKALKAGPYGADDSTARDAVGGCNKKYATYADEPDNSWIFALNVFALGAGLLGLLIAVFVVLLWLAVIVLAWSSLRAMFHALWAIMPGNSRGPLIRDLCDILVSLVYVALGTALLSVLMAMIKTVLQANGSLPIFAQFLALDLMLIACIILVIVNYLQHRRGAKTMFRSIADRFRQTSRTPLGEKLGGWLKQPSPGSTMLTRDASGAVVPALSQGPIKRVLASNAGRIGVGGATLALAATTGGASLAGKGVMLAGKTSIAASKGTYQGYQAARTIQRTYSAVHRGAARATTGNTRVDSVLRAASRAHQHVQAKVDAGVQQASNVPHTYSVTRHGGTASTGNTRLDRLVGGAGRAHSTVERAGINAVAATVLGHGRPAPRPSQPMRPEQVIRSREQAPQDTLAKRPTSSGRAAIQSSSTPVRRARSQGASAPQDDRATPNPVVVELARARTRKSGTDG